MWFEHLVVERGGNREDDPVRIMRKLTQAEFIERARKVHRELYCYDLASYVDSRTKVTIICNRCEGQFLQCPDMHLMGNGCPKCNDTRWSNEKFLDEARKIHGDQFNYDKVVYKNSYTKVEIVCNECGNSLRVRPSAHIGKQKSGCSYCAFDSKRLSKDEFVAKCRITHGNRYDYRIAKYTSYAHKVSDLICLTCGLVFDQKGQSHLNGNGCRWCSGNRITHFEFVSRAATVHNNEYDYRHDTFRNTTSKFKIWCPKCMAFFHQNCSHHMAGNGCPNCAISSTSEREVEWLDYLGIPEEWRQVKLPISRRGLRVDAVDRERKIVYEFYGDYFHGNPKRYARDVMNTKTLATMGVLYDRTMAREAVIKEAGYTIISIWESEWNALLKRATAGSD
jgi:hypothetical protein